VALAGLEPALEELVLEVTVVLEDRVVLEDWVVLAVLALAQGEPWRSHRSRCTLS